MPDPFGECRYRGAFPAVAAGVRIVRDEVGAIAAECGLDNAAVSDVKLAVSEAASNAIVHGYRDEPGEIRVSVYYGSGQLLVIVADDGAGMAPRLDTPGLGLGLPMIATIAQSMEVIAPDDGGTEIHMIFPCPHGVQTPA
jgi:anti-sigma regulatory factor (Ser/Thr protein kinase)